MFLNIEKICEVRFWAQKKLHLFDEAFCLVAGCFELCPPSGLPRL